MDLVDVVGCGVLLSLMYIYTLYVDYTNKCNTCL